MAKNNEIEDLKSQIEGLKSIIEKFSKNEKTSIDEKEDILFTSLCVGMLNLSTKSYLDGGGEVYTFEKFGDEQLIPYEDAKNIIRNNRGFIIGGKVFIHDDNLINKYHLEKFYEHLLDDKEILKIFDENINVFEKVYKDLPLFQKETLKDLMEQKILNNEKYDMNMVKIINDALGVDILSSIENGKNLKKE